MTRLALVVALGAAAVLAPAASAGAPDQDIVRVWQDEDTIVGVAVIPVVGAWVRRDLSVCFGVGMAPYVCTVPLIP